jgi:type IV pilus assembly protein PilE
MKFPGSKRPVAKVRLTTGFTLIEVMIVVAIVGILSAIALPSYRSYVERGDRASARAALLDAQQFMERFYVANDSYSTDKGGNAVALPARLASGVPTDSPRYTLGVAAAASTPNQFTLTATPLQTVSKCGNLTLEHTGVKGISTPASATSAQIAECWK